MKRIATVVALGLLLAGCAYYGPGYGYGYYGPGFYSNSGYGGGYPGVSSGEGTASPGGVFSG